MLPAPAVTVTAGSASGRRRNNTTEVIAVETTHDLMAALDLPDAELRRIGANARERVLADHTSARRAEELVALLGEARRPGGPASTRLAEEA